MRSLLSFTPLSLLSLTPLSHLFHTPFTPLQELRKLLVVMRGRQFEEPVMEVMDKISGGIIQKCQQVLQKSKVSSK